LRARTTLSTVIGRSVKLTRAGREWKACCPFHKEKTPSFTVNDEKGFYHCFGCSAHGDAITWLTEVHGLAFLEAVKELADAAGLEVPAQDPRTQREAERVAPLYDAMEAAARWFEDQLGGIEGGEARAYLDKRGIAEATRKRFRLGFAPNKRSTLKSALQALGVETLVEAGLVIRPEGRREPYDRFRGRLMFPIRDVRGRVTAFGGRTLGGGEPKYLNSPETPLFDKGRTLFNIDRVGPASRERRRVIVVERYMDVIALDQAGIAEALAPLGTALTEGQLERLWRLSPAPILCFDGDPAGQEAAVRAAVRGLPHVGANRLLAFVTLPVGQDPDDLIRASGKQAVEALLASPMSLVDRIWRHEAGSASLDTPEARAALRQRLAEHASMVVDKAVRREYDREFRTRLDALLKPAAGRRSTRRPGPPIRTPLAVQAKMVAAVLQGLARFPDVASDIERVAALPTPTDAHREAVDRLVTGVLAGKPPDPGEINSLFPGEIGWKGLRFSFMRAEPDPARAREDLAAALVAIVNDRLARPSSPRESTSLP
ncbi:MAG TPA: DNA primase, partial [Allosphingosinicella sp.]